MTTQNTREIILFTRDGSKPAIEVRLDGETVCSRVSQESCLIVDATVTKHLTVRQQFELGATCPDGLGNLPVDSLMELSASFVGNQNIACITNCPLTIPGHLSQLVGITDKLGARHHHHSRRSF